MRKSINLNRANIDDLAAQAEELSTWLETKALPALQAGRAKIPPELTTIGSAAFTMGLLFLLDGDDPGVICWGSGGCQSGG